MVVGDKTPKQSPVKVFQFASKFVGYNHFASVLRVKVTRPSFFGGYHPTLKLSDIPTFTFIVSLTQRMDNI